MILVRFSLAGIRKRIGCEIHKHNNCASHNFFHCPKLHYSICLPGIIEIILSLALVVLYLFTVIIMFHVSSYFILKNNSLQLLFLQIELVATYTSTHMIIATDVPPFIYLSYTMTTILCSGA